MLQEWSGRLAAGQFESGASRLLLCGPGHSVCAQHLLLHHCSKTVQVQKGVLCCRPPKSIVSVDISCKMPSCAHASAVSSCINLGRSGSGAICKRQNLEAIIRRLRVAKAHPSCHETLVVFALTMYCNCVGCSPRVSILDGWLLLHRLRQVSMIRRELQPLLWTRHMAA